MLLRWGLRWEQLVLQVLLPSTERQEGQYQRQ